MRGLFTVLVPVLLAVALAGCDKKRIDKLEEGVATEADVKREFGDPAAVYADADGSRTLEYPRQPEGDTNYFITIGPDGRMSSLRQVLKEANFAEVTPGLDKAQVRRLIGRPARTQVYELKGEEVWDWRWKSGQQAKLFSVTFDRDGRVVTTASADDNRDAAGVAR